MGVFPDHQRLSGKRAHVVQGSGTNGVLLDDSHGTLQRELRQSIESLPPKYRQRLQGCFEELVKNKKQRIIKMPAQATRGGVRGTMTRLNELHPVDALCVSEETLQSLGEPPPNALPVVEYAYSEVESLRERYLAEMPPPARAFHAGSGGPCGRCVTASGSLLRQSKVAKART